MTGLLVSVRSVAEADAALAGAAGLIDVKEPRHGSLGRADEDTIRAVVRLVAGRRPVSAALGELVEDPALPSIPGLAFVKWGLSRCGSGDDWRQRLDSAGSQLRRTNPHCRPVAVAYADCHRAGSPPPADVCAFALKLRWPAFLIDTWLKDGSTLLDWLTLPDIIALCARCREADVQIALAGSLGPTEIARLFEAAPDWFAVRGAVCRSGRRDGDIDPEAVRRLADLIERRNFSLIT